MAELVAMEQQIAVIFRDILKISVPTPETDLLATGMLDSVGFVNLILYLEERFGIHVAMETLGPDDLRSITSIAAFVEAQRKAA